MSRKYNRPIVPHSRGVSEKRPSMVKQRDIAAALNISIGTVDRALHNRGRIDESTKHRVLEAASAMGYHPNLAASVLASRRRIRVSVNLPAEIAYFYDQVREGIRLEHEAIAKAAVDLEYRTFPRLGVGEIEAFHDAIDHNVQGIITAFGDASNASTLLRAAARRNIQVLSVVTGASPSIPLPAVSNNPRLSGTTAAGLVAGFLKKRGKVATETGNLLTWEHQEKMNSFRDALHRISPHLKVLPTIETRDKPNVAYRETLVLLDANPDIVAYYVSTSNSPAVIRALKARGLLGKVVLIATDPAPALIRYIRSGEVTATIHERPLAQGELALRNIYGILSEGKYALDRVLLQPHVVMGSNLDEFLGTYENRKEPSIHYR
jgi:LacI family transcriptional regulator